MGFPPVFLGLVRRLFIGLYGLNRVLTGLDIEVNEFVDVFYTIRDEPKSDETTGTNVLFNIESLHVAPGRLNTVHCGSMYLFRASFPLAEIPV